jgi:Flp pilus assembly protein TadB
VPAWLSGAGLAVLVGFACYGVGLLAHHGAAAVIPAVVFGVGAGVNGTGQIVRRRRWLSRLTGRDPVAARELARCAAQDRVPADPADRAALHRLLQARLAAGNTGPVTVGATAGFGTAVALLLTVLLGPWPWLAVTLALAALGAALTWQAVRANRRAAALDRRLTAAAGVG